ncbi:inactive beta-amylase 9 [Coffea eugenioides]|uniref:Beta-amylase n=1 Tax=Coffea arabica TaxID=13443 RepID=A0ABM4X8F3_COFAR|nr:inactive beta-amylase 9 [Coffea arabica]XP_027164656.1 inactive beta-amylase 9-like [Coffea eugenioides]XP_027165048.1 inactive beta-amylase 9 [Coffea eugenioides]
MEVSVIGSSQVNNLGRVDLRYREVGLCSFSKNLNFAKISSQKYSGLFVGQSSISWPSKYLFPLIVKASATAQTEAAVTSEKASGTRRSEVDNNLMLYVGLPLDAVSSTNTINHARAIAAGLKALKLLGVDGVELPIWWGIAEKEARGQYNWAGYLSVAEMVQKMGLKLHVSLCFHACKESRVPLPEWVSQIGESQPDIYFTDRSGQRCKDCLSLSVDDLPIFDGKTPIQVYKEFCENFKTSFSSFMGSTITGISIGLGPDGELRYPSYHKPAKSQGAGEFQCYDKNMLSHLKQHAEASGNPLWGLSGPHDAPSSNELATSSGFLKEHGGSWESQYGDFFLSWYAGQLISHGDRLLSLASSTFSDVPIAVSGKVPLMHSWYQTRSHPVELMAGIYNTVNRDGYEGIIEVFSRNSCKAILPGIDLADEDQPKETRSSPESLLEQIIFSCRKYGIEISGQNERISGSPSGFQQIKKNLTGENAVDLFTYQRMGASFFSPEHFPSFTAFVRDLRQPQLHSDDLPVEKVDSAESLPEKNVQMQAA